MRDTFLLLILKICIASTNREVDDYLIIAESVKSTEVDDLERPIKLNGAPIGIRVPLSVSETHSGSSLLPLALHSSDTTPSSSTKLKNSLLIDRQEPHPLQERNADDLDFGSGVVQSSGDFEEACALSYEDCSQDSFCMDYPSGFCCHCRPGYYGNGRQCLPEGVPQRVSGKVWGLVAVGNSLVELADVDLHAYMVVGDGRAFTALSRVPDLAGPALTHLAPVGGLFGWLFALETPQHRNGFSVTGAEFTCHTEMVFSPGDQRVSIAQEARGLDDQSALSVDTRIHGDMPFVAPGAIVQIQPYRETFRIRPSVVTATSVRRHTVVSVDGSSETFSVLVRRNVTFRHCPHSPPVGPPSQQLRVERVTVMYEAEERSLRYSSANAIGPVAANQAEPPPVNPCYDGTHDCHPTALCLPREAGVFYCQCAPGYWGDGRSCYDLDECAEGLGVCGSFSRCVNVPGSHHCLCHRGYQTDVDGWSCADIDECLAQPCHHHASCSNFPGSFECRCWPGFQGDGFQCLPPSVHSDSRLTPCEQHRDAVLGGLGFWGGLFSTQGTFVPQCDGDGGYRPLQCHDFTGHCWCVDSRGRERAGTRTTPGTPPTNCDQPGIPTVAPPTKQPPPSPSVDPPSSGPVLLYAQAQEIRAFPLNGPHTDLEKASVLQTPQGSMVVGIDYDCLEKMVYWTDPATHTISRARLDPWGQPETIVNSGLARPEGLAVDPLHRTLFWVDSGTDRIERSSLDGSARRVLFNSDLLSPRAIVADSTSGTLYWTDWNRHAPKIESSSMDGHNRRVLVHYGIRLPNALTFDPSMKHLCWADAGTKRLECISPDGTGRREIRRGLSYPFSLVSHGNHFFYSDWKRDAVLVLSADGDWVTEYLPDKKSQLYGVTVISPHCSSGF